MTEIKWQEPPAGRRGARDNRCDDVATALKKNPGAWALVDEGVLSSRVNAWKRRGLETRMRRIGEVSATAQPLYNIYARYVERGDQ